MNKLRFVYLLQVGERIYSPHIHTTWEEPFSAALYLSGQNKDKGKINGPNWADRVGHWA